MSRLHSFIRRVQAQAACLDAAAAMIAGVPGVVFELGLGNGRTYDHLREILPDREIYVFERRVAAHPDAQPDPDHLFLGDVRETLPTVVQRFSGKVALVHGDIGAVTPEATIVLMRALALLLMPLLAPGAVVVSDQKIELADGCPIPLPKSLLPGRYFMTRFEPAHHPLPLRPSSAGGALPPAIARARAEG